jgi:hypothetical protein
MLHAIVSAFIGVAAFIGSLFGAAPHPDLGAALPSGTAVFETSLQSRISSTDTSLTLTANSVRGGSTLSGYNCFTIDEGRTDAEYVCGSVSGASVTSLERGIDPLTGTTTNSTLKFAHRVGANVKITDFPLIQRLRSGLNGGDTLPNTIHYASGVTPTATGDLADKEYVDGVAFSGAGIIDATAIAKGVAELATGCEAASSTSAGGSGNLVVPASLATSTFINSTLSACKVVSTGNTGLIDENFLSSTTARNATTTGAFAATATSSVYIGSFPAYQIGKNIQVFSSVGTTTFSVPSGISKVKVQVVGAGGGGATGNGTGAGGGGGAGGYALEYVNVSGTTTIQVFVGTGGSGGNPGSSGTWSTFGTNGFYLSAFGGSGGTQAGVGGTAGVGSGGDINLTGNGGCGGRDSDADANASGACGGGSFFGGGGFGPAGDAASTGGVGTNGGGGGGGAKATTGASGGNGIVVVEW